MFGAAAVALRSDVAVRPRYHLGDSDSAAQTLVVSSKALEGVQGWLSGIRPANWTDTAKLVQNRAAIEIGNLSRNVLGQLGSDEGEETAQVLSEKWGILKEKADTALENPPGWLQTASDKAAVFAADFSEGAASAWQDYVGKAVVLSGPVLRKYYDSAVRLMNLESDLSEAKDSGKFSQADLSAQAARIQTAENGMARARSLFSGLSGGASIDQIAQEQYGSYSLGAAWLPGIAIVLSALAIVIYLAGNAVDKIRTLLVGNSDGAKAIPGGAIGLLFLIVIPLLIARD